MALLINAARLRDNKKNLLEGTTALASVIGLIKTSEDGFSNDELREIAIGEAISTSIGVTIDILQLSNQELLDSANNVKSRLTTFRDQLQGVETTAKNGEVATLIGGVLPGVGPVITRLQLNDLLSNIDDRADPIQSDLNAAISNNQSIINKLEDEKETLDKVETAITALELAYEIVDLSLEFYQDASDEVATTTSSAATSLGALSTDARAETAFESLTNRFEAKSSAVTNVVDQAKATTDPIEALFRDQIAPAIDNIQDAAGRITAPVNTLAGAAGAFQPFVNAVGVFANPVNDFLDLLEEGPGILPSIPRSAINTILDFLDGLSGLVSRAFDFFFGDLLAPLDNLANSLFSKLVDLSPLSSPADLLDSIVDQALSALNVLQPLFDQVEIAITSLVNLPTIGLDEFVADPGDLRETFFGADTADVITGVAPTAALAEGVDIAGAVLNGAGGDDMLTGTALTDLLIGGADDDMLDGLAGDDVIVGGPGNDTITGGAGDDIIDSGAGVDIAVFSGLFADYEIREDDLVITVAGPDGVDELVGVETLRFADRDVAARQFLPEDFPGADQRGSAAPDLFEGGDGGDTLGGGAGRDTLKGGGGKDSLKGGSGDDRLLGNAGDDTLKGNGGNDVIRGGGGDDNIRAGGGDDRVNGGGGADMIRGNGGDDNIRGGGGDDTIIGGRGDDTMLGGGGADQFVFGPNDGDDTILRFQQGRDQIEFRGARDFDDLAIEQTDDGALISFRNTTVLVDGQREGAFSEDDFIF